MRTFRFKFLSFRKGRKGGEAVRSDSFYTEEFKFADLEQNGFAGFDLEFGGCQGCFFAVDLHAALFDEALCLAFGRGKAGHGN